MARPYNYRKQNRPHNSSRAACFRAALRWNQLNGLCERPLAKRTSCKHLRFRTLSKLENTIACRLCGKAFYRGTPLRPVPRVARNLVDNNPA